MIGLLGVIAASHAIDVNDQVVLNLAGGEAVDGWFVRYHPDVVVVHVPNLGDSVDVPLGVVETVFVNGTALPRPAFVDDLKLWHEDWVSWLENTPPAPPGVGVALVSVGLAGSGHAWLGDWNNATGMLVADALGMGVMAWELEHQKRLNVVSGALTVSLVMKIFGATDAVRKARILRQKRAEYSPR